MPQTKSYCISIQQLLHQIKNQEYKVLSYMKRTTSKLFHPYTQQLNTYCISVQIPVHQTYKQTYKQIYRHETPTISLFLPYTRQLNTYCISAQIQCIIVSLKLHHNVKLAHHSYKLPLRHFIKHLVFNNHKHTHIHTLELISYKKTKLNKLGAKLMNKNTILLNKNLQIDVVTKLTNRCSKRVRVHI